MTDHTTLPHRLVLVNKGAALGGMALKASLVSAQESKAAAFEHLLNIGPATFDGNTDVRVVAIGAAHFAFQHRMVVRQLKLRPHFQMTLETSFRRLTRIDDRVRCAAAGNVETPRAVTRFASRVLGVIAGCLQPRVRRSAEIAGDIFVAGLARFRSNECCARNARGC